MSKICQTFSVFALVTISVLCILWGTAVAVSWSSSEPVNAYATDDSGMDNLAHIVVDADLTLHAVWHSSVDYEIDEEHSTGGDSDILYSKKILGGNWTSPVLVNNYGIGPADGGDYWPELAIDSSGTLHCVWFTYHNLSENDYPELDIAYSKNDGSGWSDVTPVNTTVDDDGMSIDQNPHLAVSDDTVHVVWESQYSYPPNGWGADYDIFYASNDGGGWSAPVLVNSYGGSDSVVNPTEEDYFPKIYLDSNGTLHAVWYSNIDEYVSGIHAGSNDTDIFYSYNSGAGWQQAELVNTYGTSDSPNDRNPIITESAALEILVAWQSEYNLDTTAGTDFDILYSYKTASWQPADLVNSDGTGGADGDDRFPRVLRGRSGTLHAVWDSDSNVHYASYLDESGGWSSPMTVFNLAPGNPLTERYPDIAEDAKRSLHVIWHSIFWTGGYGADDDIFYSTRDPMNLYVNASGGADYTTIQQALDNAVSTYEIYNVIVEDGIYSGIGNMNLDFGGKSIYLRSENGPTNCTIDPNDESRAFTFNDGEIANAVVEGFTITDGSATQGGAILCNNSSAPTFKNCVITYNEANWGAGARLSSADATFIDCTFDHNTAVYGGGALHAYQSDPQIIDCTFSNNTVTDTVTNGYGGGIYCSSSSEPTIQGADISTNAAKRGGGVYLSTSPATLIECSIDGNTSNNDGGGIYTYSSDAIFSDCTISDNSANKGGGIYCSTSDDTIVECTIDGNTSTLDGGGVYLYGSDAAVTFTSITDNTAGSSYYGGGMYIVNSTPTIDACFVNGNEAYYGAGVFLSQCDFEITNCTITNNSADGGGGGGLYTYGARTGLDITHCTFSGNTATAGGGIHSVYSLISVINSIFWDNAATGAGDEAALYTYTYLDVDFSDGSTGAGKTYADETSYYNLTGNNISEDPLFVDVENLDYHLQWNSPCRDTESDAGVETDIDGDTRDDGYPDMGSDEYYVE